MNRIDALFKKKKKAFVAYICAGDPSLEKTVEIAASLERAGADIVELGVPFSDPLADGSVNQAAAQRALSAGASVKGVLETAKKIRETSQIPLVLFTYYNPIFKFGLEPFLKEAEAAGVDGVLLLDLPPEETSEWPKHSPVKRISLIAPTTPPERVKKIVKASSGFIYYVSREGVTGAQETVSANLAEQVAGIRKFTKLPVCVGFGISNPGQVKTVADIADGVVVGSAIVAQIAEHNTSPDLTERVYQFVKPLTDPLKPV